MADGGYFREFLRVQGQEFCVKIPEKETAALDLMGNPTPDITIIKSVYWHRTPIWGGSLKYKNVLHTVMTTEVDFHVWTLILNDVYVCVVGHCQLSCV